MSDDWIVETMSEHLPWSRSHRLGYACLPKGKDNQPIVGINRWILEWIALNCDLGNTHWEINENENLPIEEISYIHADYDKAERIIFANQPRIKPGIDPCYHRHSDGYDFIIMPRLDDCVQWRPNDGNRLYWWWIFHELVHWATYGFDRLAWKGEIVQGELIAQLGAGILVDYCGIPSFTDKKGPYHDIWIKEMVKDITYFHDAVDVAEQAVAYLLFDHMKPLRATGLQSLG